MTTQIIHHHTDRLIELIHGAIMLVASTDGAGVTLGTPTDSIDFDIGELACLSKILNSPEVQRLIRLFSRPSDDAYPDPAGGGPIADWLQAQFGLSKLPE